MLLLYSSLLCYAKFYCSAILCHAILYYALLCCAILSTSYETRPTEGFGPSHNSDPSTAPSELRDNTTANDSDHVHKDPEHEDNIEHCKALASDLMNLHNGLVVAGFGTKDAHMYAKQLHRDRWARRNRRALVAKNILRLVLLSRSLVPL